MIKEGRKMYRYETHSHTFPVSKCARVSPREVVEFYKEAGYDGIFITNHFIDGNINIERSRPYEERINFYFSDYEEAKKLEDEIGIKVFYGVEVSYMGIDFLVYGLDKEWFLAHPEIETLSFRNLKPSYHLDQNTLRFFRQNRHLILNLQELQRFYGLFSIPPLNQHQPL